MWSWLIKGRRTAPPPPPPPPDPSVQAAQAVLERVKMAALSRPFYAAEDRFLQEIVPDGKVWNALERIARGLNRVKRREVGTTGEQLPRFYASNPGAFSDLVKDVREAVRRHFEPDLADLAYALALQPDIIRLAPSLQQMIAEPVDSVGKIAAARAAAAVDAWLDGKSTEDVQAQFYAPLPDEWGLLTEPTDEVPGYPLLERMLRYVREQWEADTSHAELPGALAAEAARLGFERDALNLLKELLVNSLARDPYRAAVANSAAIIFLDTFRTAECRVLALGRSSDLSAMERHYQAFLDRITLAETDIAEQFERALRRAHVFVPGDSLTLRDALRRFL